MLTGIWISTEFNLSSFAFIHFTLLSNPASYSITFPLSKSRVLMNEHEEQRTVENTRLVNLCKYKIIKITIPISIIIVIVFLIWTMRGWECSSTVLHAFHVCCNNNWPSLTPTRYHHKTRKKNIIKNGFVHLITCNYSIEKI